MRLLYLIFLLGAVSGRANSYYFSSRDGDDSRTVAQAQQAATPWKTLSKLNACFSNLLPGDSVLFKRGDVFKGTLRITQSGTAGNPIVLAAFGNGPLPVISGFSGLTNWTSVGKGIWRAPCGDCGMSVNMLTIDGNAIPMGRSPNAGESNGGFATIQSHVKKQSISDDNLGNGPDWTGAEIVMRKNRFIIDKSKIVSQSGNTINYKSGNYYEPTDKFGYFIQNDIRTLDQKGEWYYDPNARTMSLYYGSEDPSGAEIRASSVDTLVVIKNKHYLVFDGLFFLGSNLDVFNLTNADNISITHCRISFAGLNAIKGLQTDRITIGNVEIRNSNNNAIDIRGTGSLVGDNKISRTGTIPGMGTGEQSYLGIHVAGTGNTVQYNQVDTTGYVPIFFLGSSNTILNNVVRAFAFVKDDGGGIYTWSGDIDSGIQRNTGTIVGNIVLDGITAPGGTDGKQPGIANGIYLDENSGMLAVTGNTVSRCTGGIFLQDAHEVIVKENTLYDNGFQLALRHPLVKGTLRNNRIIQNTLVARTGEQTVLILSSAVSGEVSSYAEFEDNNYAQLSSGGGGNFFRVVTRPAGGNQTQSRGSLDQWKSGFGKDKNSRVSTPVGPALFEFNKDKTVRTLNLNGTYADLSGKTYKGEIKLAPFSSVLLFKK
ncbi:right-handed parallel beta-helix repeat-containing protein [Flavitalea flava]